MAAPDTIGLKSPDTLVVFCAVILMVLLPKFGVTFLKFTILSVELRPYSCTSVPFNSNRICTVVFPENIFTSAAHKTSVSAPVLVQVKLTTSILVVPVGRTLPLCSVLAGNVIALFAILSVSTARFSIFTPCHLCHNTGRNATLGKYDRKCDFTGKKGR